MENKLNWSDIYKYRLQIRNQFPTIWEIDIVHSVTERIADELSISTHLLDIGASDRKLEKKLRAKGFMGNYKSMDIDCSTFQDYYSLEEIKEQFDAIVMLEVVEHITPEEYLDILDKSKCILKPKGKLIISTPNLYHPNRYWNDMTHKTAYTYENLAALTLLKGFNSLNLYRIHGKSNIKWRIFSSMIGIHMNKYLGIDYAHTIVLVCHNS